MKNSNKGFTLTELVIVLAIIGILAMIAIPAYVGQAKRATRSEAYSNLQTLRLLEEQFFSENSCYQPLAGGICPAAAVINGTLAIQGFLPGFRPGTGGSFTYVISVANGVSLPNVVAVPYDNAIANLPNANAPCFIATATGAPGSRVAGDVFAVDCINNRNF